MADWGYSFGDCRNEISVEVKYGGAIRIYVPYPMSH